MNPLAELADRHGSDKGIRAGRLPHRYTFLYDLIFHEFRSRPIAIAEIGLAVGGPELGGSIDRSVAAAPSIAMWQEYFPSARIFGFDISEFGHLQNDRFVFVRGDSGNEEDLRRFAAASDGFDLIIDDGSHASYHQQLALRVLLPRLRQGGLYVIEDLNWQSPHYEGILPPTPRTADLLHSFMINDVYIENTLFSRPDLEAMRRRLQSFAVFPDFSTRRDGQYKLAVMRGAP